ncbi:hypothetical protein J6590_075917 [Homalodisca vitripennis]|nr:hypothetical protein J6590_075917 [Homalodisca vitripennis]
MIDVARTKVPGDNPAPITNGAKVIIVDKSLLENYKLPKLLGEPFGKDITANSLPWRVIINKFTKLCAKVGEQKIDVSAIIVELNGTKLEIIFNLH